MGAGIEHRLDRKGHSFLEYEPCARLAVVEYLGIFVEYSADAVAAIFPHD